jgi:serine/threonine protein kinase/Zn-finger nucleic acid-binding protein
MLERLGRYHVIRPMATGGMGEIFLAEHTGLSGFAKRVALKRIKPEFARHDGYLELFLNEARLGSFLNHPNIVHIFDVGHEGDSLWLVMEYVDGIDLKRLLRRSHLKGQPLSPVTLAGIMVEVLSALEEAHAGGPLKKEPIIHRDLSPENVLIARSGAVKVLDFGLAKWSPGAHAVPSMEGNLIFGKIRYMPPEQLRGELIDVRADLFALGVTMYETLTNTVPFGSDNANSVLAAILAGRPPSPTGKHKKQDMQMDAIVYKALEPDPIRRFQTAREMRQALVDYLIRARAQLPLEELRRMLRPQETNPRSGDVTVEMHAPSLGRAPTEIGLNIAKRCGKCGGLFSALFLEGLILDRCATCRGIWFDHAEIERIVGAQKAPQLPAETEAPLPAPLDTLIGSCPSCRVGLRSFRVPGAHASLEVCPLCLGVWFDHGELSLLEELDISAWIKNVIDQLRFK